MKNNMVVYNNKSPACNEINEINLGFECVLKISQM